MSGHTPGPWFIAGGTTVYALKHHSWRKGVAQFQNSLTIAIHGDDAEANALLIAAAPELLAIAINGESLISGDLTGPEWKRACADFVREARAAIAKATGEGK